MLMLIISIIIFNGYVLSDIAHGANKIIERPIRAELALKIGSDKANEDFYKIFAFSVAKNGNIYILDSGNSRIQCFSKEGKFLFGFGRKGQGPGELSNTACKIKILSDGNIYVIDNSQRRINVFSLEGKFLYLAKTSAWYNDIELMDNTYYLSSSLLKEGEKPIHVSRTLGKIDADFGIFVEPAVGILKQINQLPMPEPWRYYFGDVSFTRLVATNKRGLIYAQGYPYRLIKYDAQGKVLKDIMGDVDFDTFQHVKYKVDSFGTTMITNPADAAWIIHDLSLRDDNQLVVPYLNPEKKIYYIDIYDLDLNLMSRYRLLNVLTDISKGDYAYQVRIDNDNNLYAMVSSKEDYPRLFKYKLIFD
jgi:hypothetical protein